LSVVLVLKLSKMKRLVIIVMLGLFLVSSCARRVVYVKEPQQTIVIKKAPRNHKMLVVKGKRYYFWNGKYHRKTTNGYVIAKI